MSEASGQMYAEGGTGEGVGVWSKFFPKLSDFFIEKVCMTKEEESTDEESLSYSTKLVVASSRADARWCSRQHCWGTSGGWCSRVSSRAL